MALATNAFYRKDLDLSLKYLDQLNDLLKIIATTKTIYNKKRICTLHNRKNIDYLKKIDYVLTANDSNKLYNFFNKIVDYYFNKSFSLGSRK